MKRNVFDDDLDSLEGDGPVVIKKRVLFRPDTEVELIASQNDQREKDLERSKYEKNSSKYERSIDISENSKDISDYMDYPLELSRDSKIGNSPNKSGVNNSLLLALTPSIGLLMMQKMGFQLGQTLGKPGIASISEPIKAVKKSNRLGIGAPTEEDEVVEETELKSMKEKDVDLDSYRATLVSTNTMNHKLLLRIKLMKAAMELAENNGKTASEDQWLWQPYIDMQEQEQERERHRRGIVEIGGHKDEDTVIDDKSDYKNDDKSENNSDNNQKIAKSDYYKIDDKNEIGATEKIDRHTMAFLSIDEALEILVLYLRSYNYCFFCGSIYGDTEEMLLTCPGPTEEEHK